MYPINIKCILLKITGKKFCEKNYDHVNYTTIIRSQNYTFINFLGILYRVTI